MSAELIDKLIKVVIEREQYQRAYDDIGFDVQIDVEGIGLNDCIIKSTDIINGIRDEIINKEKDGLVERHKKDETEDMAEGIY